jgi:hypothetical protein
MSGWLVADEGRVQDQHIEALVAVWEMAEVGSHIGTGHDVRADQLEAAPVELLPENPAAVGQIPDERPVADVELSRRRHHVGAGAVHRAHDGKRLSVASCPPVPGELLSASLRAGAAGGALGDDGLAAHGAHHRERARQAVEQRELSSHAFHTCL